MKNSQTSINAFIPNCEKEKRTRSIYFFFASVFILLGFFKSYAQDATTPEQFRSELMEIAPHRPDMIRDPSGTFHGGSVTYIYEKNKLNLDEWIRNYPDEFTAYKDKIDPFLKEASNITLTGEQAEIFIDLKSQWALLTNN